MPPATGAHQPPYPGVPQDRPADWPPPVINPALLADLPVPIQLMVATAVLPLEVALTSVKILKNTEALLGEMVFHLNALRPAVAGVSQAYASGQFDQVFRTIDQIQHSTNAIALVWAPFTAVRDRLVPGMPVMDVPSLPPVTPRRPPVPPRPVPPMAPLPAAPGRKQPPSTTEWLGRLGGQVWDQANSLPGAGLVTAPLRRVGTALSDAAPRPVAWLEERMPVAVVVDPEPEDVEVPGERGPSLLPGPVRRWFGG